MILHGCFLFPSFVQATEGLLGNQARRLPVTWVSDVERGHPLRELKFFITSKSGVGNSFSCLWDWNMLVARRIKGVFHDSNYLQHFEDLSTAPKRFRNKYPFNKVSQKIPNIIYGFIPTKQGNLSRDFLFGSIRTRGHRFGWGGIWSMELRCQFVESLLFVRIHPFSSIHFCFFCWNPNGLRRFYFLSDDELLSIMSQTRWMGDLDGWWVVCEQVVMS